MLMIACRLLTLLIKLNLSILKLIYNSYYAPYNSSLSSCTDIISFRIATQSQHFIQKLFNFVGLALDDRFINILPPLLRVPVVHDPRIIRVRQIP